MVDIKLNTEDLLRLLFVRMDGKCYTIVAEQSTVEVAERVPFEAKWRLLARVGVRCYILISNVSGAVKVAPLQILQFPVVLPHKFQDAEKFNLQFPDFSEITEMPDKLRWLRYQKGLRQRDVADYAGIDRSTYVHYEEYGKDLYPLEHMERIAQLFEVPVESLLDDYNLFLRNGQGNQIKAIRMKLGLTQKEYADKLRWLRYQKGLRQRDVADYAGIYRSTYIHYEEYGKDFYSPKHMEKIAQLFEVPVERLLDDYNLFLRNGQGKQIKAIRMKLGLTQREYADRLGISLCNLKQWEQNRKQLFKSTWEKYFK